MPVCLEVEETNLAPLRASEPYPLFAAQQWRPLTEYLEDVLPRLARCVNAPRATRRANNKLIQIDALRRAGITLPATSVSTGFPRQGALAKQSRLVRKNISEGGWKSPTEFSPARLVAASKTDDPAPAIWQAPIEADREYRCYVIGDEVTFVRLERDPAVTDVRATHDGRPRALIVEGDARWRLRMLAAARALGLDYAVIDAMPVGDDLLILEVNANGVWWFLPQAVQDELEARFHLFLDKLIGEAPG
jgi:glutathione synthase/RimK-type ligase-like ATP-grasp enzyme